MSGKNWTDSDWAASSEVVVNHQRSADSAAGKQSKVFQAMNRVQGDIARLGIGKNQKNYHQKYNFRGIDDVYNALAPLLAKHGLLILPSVDAREACAVQTSKGGTTNHVCLQIVYTFISVEDGSSFNLTVYGEAQDTSDKGTPKAMSAAYKYMAIQCFAIPIVGDEDADYWSPDIPNGLKAPASQKGSESTPPKAEKASKPAEDPKKYEPQAPPPQSSPIGSATDSIEGEYISAQDLRDLVEEAKSDSVGFNNGGLKILFTDFGLDVDAIRDALKGESEETMIPIDKFDPIRIMALDPAIAPGFNAKWEKSQQ